MTMRLRSLVDSPTSELTRRYILSLVAVGLLLLTGQILIELKLIKEIDETSDLFDAGRTQTLGQSIARTALELRSTTPEEHGELLQELADGITALERRTRYLRFGDSTTQRPAEQRRDILLLLNDIEPERQAILGAARSILSRRTTDTSAEIAADIALILRHEREFTSGMSRVLRQIINHNNDQIRWMRYAQFSLLAVVVLITVISSLYVFRPAVLKLRNTIHSMQETQETLRQSEERFSKIFHSAPLPICITTRDNIFVTVNRAFEEFTGYSQTDLAHRVSFFTALRVPGPEETAIARTIAERRAVYNTELSIRRRDGSTRTTLVSIESIVLDGKPSLITTLKDITERTAAARELERKELYFRSLIEHSNDIIAVLGPEGTIRYCSPTVAHILGYDPDLVTGRSVFDFVYHDDRARLIDLLSEVRTQPDAVLKVSDFQLLRSNGTLAHFEAVASNQLDRPGVEGIIINARDISERRQAEENIRRSQEQFSRMFRLAPVPICITTLVESRFVDVNDAYAAMTGYTREELIGNTVDALHIQPPEARRDTRKVVTEMRMVGNFETELLTRDGNRRSVLTSLEHIDINNEMCVLAISVDITEIRQMRAELSQSEERFTRVFATSPAAISITTADEGRFVDVNPAFCETVGFPREELIGSTALELGMIDHVPFRTGLVDRLRTEGRLQRIESTFRSKNGELRRYISSADLMTLDGREHVLSIGLDITELAQAEELRRQYEQQFSTIFEVSPAGICISTVHEGRYVEVNDAFCTLTGYTREELVGSTSVELDILPAEYRNSLLDLLHNSTALKHMELQIRHKSGEHRWILASIEPIVMDGEERLVSVFIDIDDLKRGEEERRQLEERFSKVFYTSPIPILITTEREGDIVDANESYVRLSGYPREELIGRNVIDLGLVTYADDRMNLLRALDHQPGLADVTGTMRTRDGQECILLVSVERIRLGGVPHLLKMAVDVTGRVHSATALAESERRFRSLFDLAAIGIGMVDLNRNWLIVNQRLCDIMGYSREEFLTPGFQRLTHPDDIPLDTELVESLMRGEIGEFSIEKRYRRKDGALIWGRTTTSLVRDDNGNPQYFIRVVQDITGQKADREALKASEERFFRIFHSSPIAIVVTTLAEGRILDANTTYEALTGYTREELIGKTSFDLALIDNFTVDDRRALLASDPRIRNRELHIRTKPGVVRTALLSVEQTVIDGTPCLISMMLDITELQQTSALLQQQEAYFRSIIEHSSDVILVLGRGFRIRYASPSCERLLGYTPDDLIGTSDLPFLHPDDLSAVEHALLNTLRSSERGVIDCFRVQRRDGEVRFFDLTLSNLTDTPFVEGIVMACRDITERVQAERELRESSLRLRATFDQAAVGIAHVSEEGRWLRVNDRLCAITGYSREELLTRTFQEITHPDDLEADLRQAYRLSHNEIQSYSMEKRYVRRDGSPVWVNITCSAVRDGSGTFKFYIVFVEDISRRRRSEEALRESETRFRIMADTAPVMVWMSDTDNILTFCNKGWLTFTGRSMQQELGTGWTERVHPDDLVHCLQAYSRNFVRRSEFRVEYRLLRHDNEYRWLLNHGVPRTLPDGTFAGYIGTCIDITDIRNASLELARAADSADHLRRVQNLLLSNLGREIRTPLHDIMGFSSLLGRESDTPELRQYAQTIHGSARFLLNTMDNILLLSQIEAGTFDTTPSDVILQHEVRMAMDMLLPEAQEKGIALRFEGSEERIVVHTSQRLLGRIVENLLHNAVKFTAEGTITINVGREVQDNTAFGTVSISDTGVGISPDFLPYVFDDYTQEEQEEQQPAGGIGLGLTVVRRAAELIRATVRVQSTRNSGSVFTVRIPLPPDSAAQNTA